jgi:hypothetical protein
MTTDFLEPGDVLLSLGVGGPSEVIQKLDGGKYSHAAVWSGLKVIESTTPRVIERSLTTSLSDHPRVRVDAYRYMKAAKEAREVVVSVARTYVDRPYPRGDLVLCGVLLAITSIVPKPAQLPILRDACNLINAMRLDRPRKGEQVTCTQLVVRAYSVAGLPIRIQPKGPAHTDLYTFFRGVGELAQAKDAEGTEGLDADGFEAVALRNSLRAGLAELVAIGPDSQNGNRKGVAPDEKAIPRDWVGAFPLLSEGEWRSALVTPFNLQESPDLEFVGPVFPTDDGGPPRIG